MNRGEKQWVILLLGPIARARGLTQFAFLESRRSHPWGPVPKDSKGTIVSLCEPPPFVLSFNEITSSEQVYPTQDAQELPPPRQMQRPRNGRNASPGFRSSSEERRALGTSQKCGRREWFGRRGREREKRERERERERDRER